MPSFIDRGHTLAPVGWIALADVFTDLVRDFMSSDYRNLPVFKNPRSDEYSEKIGGIYYATWELCLSASKIGVLAPDSSVQEFSKDPLVTPYRSWQQENELINLVDGTLGSGSGPLPIEFSHLIGRHVLLPEQSVNAFRRKASLDPQKKVGRPTNRPEIKEAYFRLYPDGHVAAQLSWKEARNQVGLQLRLNISVDTLMRAVGRKS